MKLGGGIDKMTWREEQLKKIKYMQSFRLISGLIVLAIAVSLLRDFGVPWSRMLILVGLAIVITIPFGIQSKNIIEEAQGR